MNNRLVMAGGSGSGSGSGARAGSGAGSSGSRKAGKNVVGADPKDVGLLTYGLDDHMDAVPVNLKQLEKRRLDKKVFFKN